MHPISAGLVAVLILGASEVDPTSEEALVEEVRSIHARADARPTHVPNPLSGTFAEHASPHFAALKPFRKEQLDLTKKELLPFIFGERSWDEVSPEARRLVDDELGDVNGVLEATHAKSGRLPSNLTGLLRLADPMPEDSVIRVMRVAATQGARLAQSNTPEALRYCIDGLAVARDLSYGNAIARIFAANQLGWFQSSCVRAFEAARPSPQTCAELSSIASHTAPLSELFEQEKVFIELSAYGSTLSEKTKAALPPEAQRVLDGDEVPTRSEVRFSRARMWLFGSWARRDDVRAMNDLIAVADRVPREADPLLEHFDEQHQSWSFTLVGGDDSPSKWLNFARRWREAQTRLNLIASACTVLQAKPEAGWPSQARHAMDARTGRPLQFEVDDDGTARLVAEGDRTRDAKRVELLLEPSR